MPNNFKNTPETCEVTPQLMLVMDTMYVPSADGAVMVTMAVPSALAVAVTTMVVVDDDGERNPEPEFCSVMVNVTRLPASSGVPVSPNHCTVCWMRPGRGCIWSAIPMAPRW